MTKWHAAAIGAFLVIILIGPALGLRYSQASIIFGVLALGFAYPLIHKTKSANVAAASLALLAIMASFFPRKLFDISGLLPQVLTIAGFAAVLYVAGLGWKRKWK